MPYQLPPIGADSSAFHPATAADARHLIATEGTEHTVVIYNTKADGSPRRFVARYYGHTSRRPSHIVVWDIEKGGIRTVDLETVHTVKVLRAPQRPRPAPDREPKREEKRRRFEALKAELHEYFG